MLSALGKGVHVSALSPISQVSLCFSSQPLMGVTALPHLSQGAPYKIHLKSREKSQITVLPALTIYKYFKRSQSAYSDLSLPCHGVHRELPWHASTSLADCGQLQIQANNESHQLPLSPALKKTNRNAPVEQQADGQMLSSETNKQGCYFSVELHLAFRDQPKMSVNRSISQKSFFRSCIYESGLIRVSRGIYLLIYLRRWKALGSSQDVINLKEEIMASQMVQEEMSGLSHHRL